MYRYLSPFLLYKVLIKRNQVAVTSEESNMRNAVKKLDISRVDEGLFATKKLEDHYRHRASEKAANAFSTSALQSMHHEYMDDLDGFDSEGDGLDDSVLQLLAYFKRAQASQQKEILAATVLSIFDKQIIRTHKSSTTQFILFYLASAYPSFNDRYLGYLITKALDTSSTHMLRCSAAAYLASFIARAQFLSASDVATALYLCSQWASTYKNNASLNQSSMSTSMTQHAPFYAIVQAIMYIFVFRWRDLVHSDKFLRWWNVDGSFQNTLTSPLTPLRVSFSFCCLS